MKEEVVAVKEEGAFGSAAYAADRSQGDAQVSNENSRAAAQAAILINGGAATAVLAFLSKENIDPSVLATAPFCLLGYAAGVCFGAFMTFAIGNALRWWSLAWRVYMIDSSNIEGAKNANSKALRWNRSGHFSFYASVFCFVAASGALAFILYHSRPTTRSTVHEHAALMSERLLDVSSAAAPAVCVPRSLSQ